MSGFGNEASVAEGGHFNIAGSSSLGDGDKSVHLIGFFVASVTLSVILPPFFALLLFQNENRF